MKWLALIFVSIPVFAGVTYLDDVRVDGTILGGVEDAICDYTTSPATCLPMDPRGAMRLSRYRNPNQNMSNLIISAKDASSGHIKESIRVGTTADGFPFFGFNSGGDTPNMYFRKGSDYLKIYMCGDDGACGILIKDNSGALKYESPSGKVTTIGAP